MLDKLTDHIIKRVGPDAPNLDLVLSKFQPLKVRRNQFLLMEGAVCDTCYFVAKGAVQVFVHDAEGNENTRDVVIEDNWVTELNSFGNQVPAVENIRTLESCELLAINKLGFGQMMEQVPSFEHIYRQILELSYLNSVYRINTFVAMDALQRVQWLMSHRPGLLARFSNKVVASYLGISPETLSRIKGKI